MCGALLPLDVGLQGGLLAIAVLAAISCALAALEEGAGPAWRYLGVVYVSLPPIALVMLREDPVHGIAAIVLVMLMVWAADTFAYFAGRIIGGPKLAPRISPKKTWAGLVGAMAGSALAAFAVAKVLGLQSALAAGPHRGRAGRRRAGGRSLQIGHETPLWREGFGPPHSWPWRRDRPGGRPRGGGDRRRHHRRGAGRGGACRQPESWSGNHVSPNSCRNARLDWSLA